MNSQLDANTPEWYTPSPTDTLTKVEVQHIENKELIAPSVIPQVHLIGKQTQQVQPVLLQTQKLQPIQITQQVPSVQMQQSIPIQQSLPVPVQQPKVDLIQFDKVEPLQQERTIPVFDSLDSESVSIPVIKQIETPSTSSLEKGSKLQGDKLSSEVKNVQDWRDAPVSSNDQQSKVHGDALFDSTANVRPQGWQSREDYKQSEPLTRANFGELKAQEEDFSKELNGDIVNKEISSKIQGDALLESSESSESSLSGYTKLPLKALKENSETLGQSWSPSVDRGLSTFNEKSQWDASNLEFEPVNPNFEYQFRGDLWKSQLVEINQLEESERQDRIARGVNPIWMGKVHIFQEELLHHSTRFLASLPSLPHIELPSVELPKAEEVVESIIEEAVIMKQNAEVLADKSWTWTSYLKQNVFNKTQNMYTTAKEGLGFYSVSSIKAEEKERVRRMNEKVDPMIDARKRRVEEELLTSVKAI